MPNLPSDQSFIELLQRNHNIELTQDDLRALDRFHYQLRNQSELRLANDINSVYYDVENGKVIGLIAFAAIGYFALPLLGVSAITGALIGASIGWRLFGSKKSNTNSQQIEADRRAKYIAFGFDSAPTVLPLGGVVPMIFCNRSINPNGGIRASGAVVYSRVDTLGGVQRLLTLYVLGLGQIGEIDEPGLILANQPRTNFFTDEVSTFVKKGTLDQTWSDSEYTSYSQTQSASSNSQIGIDSRGKPKNSVNNVNYIDIKDDDVFDTFNPSDRYIFKGTDIRILNRDYILQRLYIDKTVSYSSSDLIYAKFQAKYTTSKKCTEIHLNFVAQLWARNDNNDLVAHGVAADVFVDNVKVCRFFIKNKSEVSVRRRLILSNLAYSYHTIQIIPLVTVDSSMNIIRLLDSRNMITISSGVNVAGKVVQLQYENSSSDFESVSAVNNALSFDKKPQVCSDRSSPCQLTTVCEIVKPTDIGQTKITNFKGLVFASLKATASQRLSSDPSPNWFITKGLIGRTHLFAGTCNPTSSANVLKDLTATFSNLNTGCIIRNLDKQVESNITAFSENVIETASSLNWSQGDRYLVYAMDSLCYFPDIYVYTLTNRYGGVGGILPGSTIADYFVDYVSICKSRKFCVVNNFFWDGAISQSTPWQQWASEESIGSLLFPSRFGGRFGLIPEQQTEPVALFNASNIIEGSYAEDYAPKQRLNCVHVTYKDGSEGQDGYYYFRDKTASVLTQDAANGLETIFAESLQLPSVTTEAQAIRVAQVYLKTRLSQGRTITFSTGMQGYGIREGDLIIVQHITTEIDKESSGFVTTVEDLGGGVNLVNLSAPIIYGLTSDYSAAVLRLADGTVQKSLAVETFYTVEGETLLKISGLSANLKAARDNLSGDYVAVGRDIINRRIYRVSKIDPSDTGSVQLSGVLWVANMLDGSDLVTVN
jgi:hypothetical protein